ncbi:MAG: VWA domain-containing protein [Ignavibacteria bacterium]|nr:VWA domain-containing protein [Ignavibacteria bacterium]
MLVMLFACSAAEARAQPSLRISAVALQWPEVRVSFSVQCGEQQVPRISREQLTVTDNGVPVNNYSIVCPDSSSRCAISAALLFDASSSMKGEKLEGARKAGAEFIGAMDGVRDEAGVYRLAEAALPLQSLTSDTGLLRDALQRISAGGSTSIWDGCVTALTALVSGAKNPCTAMVLFTDGADSRSAASAEDVILLARAARIRVFTVCIGDTAKNGALTLLAEQTGGKAFFLTHPAQLQDAYRLIASILQWRGDDCTLRYTGSCGGGGAHNVQLIVQDLCGGADTAFTSFVAPDDGERAVVLHLNVSDTVVPARQSAVLLVSLADSLPGAAFPPAECTLRYDTALLRFTGARIPPASLLPPGPVHVTSLLPGRVQLRIPSRSVVNGKGVLLEAEFEAHDPADTALAAVELERWIFDDGCLQPVLAAGSIRIVPCRWSPHVNPSGTMRLCKGDTLTLTGESGFLAYTWYRDTSFVAGTTRILRVSEPGRYRLLARDGSGCRGESGAIEVLGNPPGSLTAGSARTIVLRPGEEVAFRCGISPSIPGLFLEGGSADLQWASPDLALVSSAWLHPAMPGDSVADIAEFTVRASTIGGSSNPCASALQCPASERVHRHHRPAASHRDDRRALRKTDRAIRRAAHQQRTESCPIIHDDQHRARRPHASARCRARCVRT